MATKEDLFREGSKLKNEKRFEEAIGKFNEAIALDDKFTLPMHSLVQCHTELARHEEAIKVARRIVELEPNDHFAYIALSRAYQRAGMIPEAEYAMMQGQQAQFRAQQAR